MLLGFAKYSIKRCLTESLRFWQMNKIEINDSVAGTLHSLEVTPPPQNQVPPVESYLPLAYKIWAVATKTEINGCFRELAYSVISILFIGTSSSL